MSAARHVSATFSVKQPRHRTRRKSHRA
jgi:hypothetical protein